MKTAVIILSLLCMACVTEAKWALVMDNVAREVYDAKPDFHKDIMSMVVNVPDAVQQNWRKSGNDWLPPKTSQDLAKDRFDELRAEIKGKPGVQARRLMASTFRYKLSGNLDAGYPDTTQPLCATASGEALTLPEFESYIQERDDEGAPQQELNALKATAKAARLYLKSLKGD